MAEPCMSDLRKAAILLASLDRDTADRLLDQMPRERAEVLRNTILGLREVERDEEQATIRKFLLDGEVSRSESSAADRWSGRDDLGGLPEASRQECRRKAGAAAGLKDILQLIQRESRHEILDRCCRLL